RSLVARTVDARSYQATASLTCAYYTYWSDFPVSGAELYPRPGRHVVVGPTNDGRTLMIVYWPHAEFAMVRTDVETAFMSVLDLIPSLAERARSAVRVDRFYGTADLPNFYRHSHGPGWAL